MNVNFSNLGEFTVDSNLITIKVYDFKCRMICKKKCDGTGWWKEYEDSYNGIHFTDNNGFEYWKEFDDNDNVVHKLSCMGEYWKDYDENDNEIHYRTSNGYEAWFDCKGSSISREKYNKIYNRK